MAKTTIGGVPISRSYPTESGSKYGKRRSIVRSLGEWLGIEGDDWNDVSEKTDEVSEAKEETSDDAKFAPKEMYNDGVLVLSNRKNVERVEASEEVSDGTQHASESPYEVGVISTKIGSMGKRLEGARKHGRVVKIHKDGDISGGTSDGGRVDEEHRRRMGQERSRRSMIRVSGKITTGVRITKRVTTRTRRASR